MKWSSSIIQLTLSPVNSQYADVSMNTSNVLGTRLACDPADIVGRITLVKLGLVKEYKPDNF